MGFPTSAFAVLGGYLFTYYNTRINEERKAQIERVNEQVKELYGPLLACVTASKSAFDAMVRQHGEQCTTQEFISAAREKPESEEAKTYRHWMKTVLQPLNEKARDIIVNRADLLEAPAVEPLLLQLVAHVSAYRVILARWEAGDLNEWSAISYPDKLLQYVQTEFEKIKKRQADLLGIASGIRSRL
ncbi:hypothetical protein WJX73_000703 [Symbiochloris irregularis]|uniref:Uncharacterized protein n=1 Tax=Symbiochloris irregularis TaxID=706552 RepID=A0AAW1NZ24_9CHLO